MGVEVFYNAAGNALLIWRIGFMGNQNFARGFMPELPETFVIGL